MANYLLLHGASSDSWYWHLVAPLLAARGHDVVAPDLPVSDDRAGLAEYAETAATASGTRDELIVVAHSMAGFTAPLLCSQLPVALIVLVAAMVPAPGESPGQWWADTRYSEARQAQNIRDGVAPDADFDPLRFFFHDVPGDVVDQALARAEVAQSDTPFGAPWPLPAWPEVATQFLLCTHDRMFPAEFQRRVVRERLGLVPDEFDSGHLPALARPVELADRLEAYRLAYGL